MLALVRARIALLLVAALVVLVSPAVPAWAAWGTHGMTVRATNASIPLITACSDGVTGSFVVWQEESIAGMGVLRAQHVLPTGEIDPSWPAEGALACSDSTSRADLGALPDRLGGLYVWWLTGGTLVVQRLDAAGLVAASWPAGGRSLGPVYYDGPTPCVIEDGAHGFYAAWSEGLYGRPLAIHLGPGNAGAGGWPNSTRGIGAGVTGTTIAYWPQLALAPDGGVFAAWGYWSKDTTVAPSDWRLRRLTTAGTNASGWPAEGLSLGAFHREWFGLHARTSTLALSPDGRGGVFLVKGDPIEGTGCPPFMTARLFRLQGDGQSAADWPADGKSICAVGMEYYLDYGPDCAYRVFLDEQDGALAGTPTIYTDIPYMFSFYRYPPDGPVDFSSRVEDMALGHETAPRVGGGLYFATFYPDGPYGPYDPDAFLSVCEWSPAAAWDDLLEVHDQPVIQWYGDIGLAATEDGGCVFFWSQVRDRLGLFARRFSTTGEVTAVESAPRLSFDLRGVRFVPGAGVRGRVTVPDGGPARIDLYDLTGRRLATQSIEALRGSRELTIPGTASLPSGVYFARVIAGPASLARRVVVLR